LPWGKKKKEKSLCDWDARKLLEEFQRSDLGWLKAFKNSLAQRKHVQQE